MSQYNESLTKIASMSYSYNHLMIFDLVQSTPNMNDRNFKHYKDKFFFMVAFVQGQNQGGGNRGYDFQSGKITQKWSTREVVSLAETLHQVGIGNHLNVLPYTKFSSSAGSKKNLSIWVPQPTQQQQNQQGGQPQGRKINISMSQDKMKHTIVLPPSDILGIAKTLTAISERAMRLEFENYQTQPFQNQNRFNSDSNGQQGFQPNQNQGNTQFNPNNYQQGGPGQQNNPFGNQQ